MLSRGEKWFNLGGVSSQSSNNTHQINLSQSSNNTHQINLKWTRHCSTSLNIVRYILINYSFTKFQFQQTRLLFKRRVTDVMSSRGVHQITYKWFITSTITYNFESLQFPSSLAHNNIFSFIRVRHGFSPSFNAS